MKRKMKREEDEEEDEDELGFAVRPGSLCPSAIKSAVSGNPEGFERLSRG
jgi:hypothetical protein